MKVALIIKDLRHCGAQRVMSRLSFILSEAGHEVYMVLLSGREIDYEYAGELIVVSSTIKNGLLGKILTTIKRTKDLKKIKKTYHFDAAISFLDTPNISNLLTKDKEKVFVSVRNFKSLEDKGLFNFLNKIMIKSLYPKADGVIVVSKAIMKDMAVNYRIPENIMRVIYNPFNIEQIQEQSSDELPDEYQDFYKNHEIIVTVGRLSRQKGYWNLIKSFYYLKKKHPQAGLVIIGDGDQEEKLKRLACDLHIENEVMFTGYQKNPFPFVKRAEIYAMTSLFEGFPNTLVEAMACGTPVVSVDCKSGPREILYKEPCLDQNAAGIEYADYGVLCPAFTDNDDWSIDTVTDNQIAFADAMGSLLENKQLHSDYCVKAIERADFFTFEKCKTYYNDLLKGE
jgi:glycosyltransferase involved in cell wall biosynthesis